MKDLEDLKGILLFDFDGTIVDSFPIVLKNANKTRIVIISSEQKLDTIEQLELDLDEPLDLDDIKNGYIKVLTCYHQYVLKKINIQYSG